MKLILTSGVESISTRVDKSFKIVLGTQELDHDEASRLISLRGQEIKVLLSDNGIEQQEEELVDTTEIKADGKKYTPSQNLRFAIYNFHRTQKDKGMISKQSDFNEYYKIVMSNLIIHYENKLNEIK